MRGANRANIYQSRRHQCARSSGRPKKPRTVRTFFSTSCLRVCAQKKNTEHRQWIKNIKYMPKNKCARKCYQGKSLCADRGESAVRTITQNVIITSSRALIKSTTDFGRITRKSRWTEWWTDKCFLFGKTIN